MVFSWKDQKPPISQITLKYATFMCTTCIKSPTYDGFNSKKYLLFLNNIKIITLFWMGYIHNFNIFKKFIQTFLKVLIKENFMNNLKFLDFIRDFFFILN